MQLGLPEILVILVIALLVLGPERLPEAARKVGKAVSDLKRLQDTVKTEFDSAMTDLTRNKPPSYNDPQSPPSEDDLDHPAGAGPEATTTEASNEPAESPGPPAKSDPDSGHVVDAEPDAAAPAGPPRNGPPANAVPPSELWASKSVPDAESTPPSGDEGPV